MRLDGRNRRIRWWEGGKEGGRKEGRMAGWRNRRIGERGDGRIR
jgi:hypothetical protein